jgi:hypothetical protein
VAAHENENASGHVFEFPGGHCSVQDKAFFEVGWLKTCEERSRLQKDSLWVFGFEEYLFESGMKSALPRVVGRFLGNGYPVGVALDQAGAGDAGKAGLAAEGLEVGRPTVAH